MLSRRSACWVKKKKDITLAQNGDRIRFLDTSILGLVFFSCSALAPCTILEKMYGGCCRKTTKLQWCWEVAIRCVFGLFKDKFIHPFWELDMGRNWRLRSKRTIFDKVREILILVFVNFYAAFVSLSPKSGTIRMRGGHVVWNCLPRWCT